MNWFIHRMLGHYMMEGEPGAGGGGDPTPAAPAAPVPAAAPAQPAAGTGADTLLGGDPAQPPADPAAPADPTKPADKPADPPAVPERYEFANLPEGYKLDEAAAAEWSSTFKDLGLSQEQVDKLVAADAKRSQGIAQAMEQQFAEARQQQLGEWVGQLKADPEFGGAKFDANVGIAQKALAAYGTPELNQWLKDSGAGSNPELVRLFHKVGQELTEGRLHRTTNEVPKDLPWANRMYPDLK